MLKRSGINVEEFLSIRRAEGLRINPSTAEVIWTYAQTLDPYAIFEVPEAYRIVGRAYFAKAPDSDIWVNFADLPEEVRAALWKKHNHEIAFPAGLTPPSDIGKAFL